MKRVRKPATRRLKLFRRLLTLSNAVQSRTEADSIDSVDDSTERYEDARTDGGSELTEHDRRTLGHPHDDVDSIAFAEKYS